MIEFVLGCGVGAVLIVTGLWIADRRLHVYVWRKLFPKVPPVRGRKK